MLLILLTIISCSPVDYPERLERNPVEDITDIYVIPHSKTAEVNFTPVINADGYDIKIKSSPDGNEETLNPKTTFTDGVYSFVLKKLTPNTDYVIRIGAKNTANDTVEDAVINYREYPFTTKDDNGELDYAPIAYVSKRTDTAAVITLKPYDGIEYKIISSGGTISNTPKTIESGLLNYELSGLSDIETYTVTVLHKSDRMPDFSELKTVLTVPKPNANFTDGYTLSISGDKATAQASTSGHTNATLLFFTTNSADAEVIKTKELSGTETVITFDITEAGTLRSGAFVVAFTGEGGSNPTYTNPVYCTTPVSPIIDMTRTTATLTWTQPEGLGDSIIYTIKGESLPPTEVELNGDNATLKFEGLTSNTIYNIEIEALFPNGETATGTTEVKTESFSGVYRWVCPEAGAKVPSFVVQVWDYEDAKSNSWQENWNKKYPYHIFVDPTDPAYTSGMKGISIMPLFRNEEEVPTTLIPYKNNTTHYEKGYRWNESKWNATGSLHPLSWKPAQEDEITGDAIVSYMNSKTFVGLLLTKTNFTFRENDGRPQLVFRNAGEGNGASTVNMGLFKNPSPANGEDSYTFTLDRIGDIPSSKEGSV